MLPNSTKTNTEIKRSNKKKKSKGIQFLTSLDVRNDLPELKISRNLRRVNPPAPAEGRIRRPKGQFYGLTKREEGREGIGEGRLGVGDGFCRKRRRHRHRHLRRRRAAVVDVTGEERKEWREVTTVGDGEVEMK